MTGIAAHGTTDLAAERLDWAPVLLSVNVGKPKDVPWQGKTVHTGAWKHPVAGPAMARRLNIDGDGQGDLDGHGGDQRAVLVYQIASYRCWQWHFGRDDFSYGQFGENLAVDGLPDDQVCIGDRYRIGGVFPGSKDLFPPQRSAGSWSLIRFRTGCCSPSRCAGGCGCGVAAAGSPTARTSCCCMSPAGTWWPTSPSAISPGGRCSPVTTAPSTATSGRRPGMSCRGRAGQAAGGVGAHRAARLRQRAKGPGGLRLAAMDAFYEEDERIVGHAADSYHRIDIRRASRHLVVRHGDQVIADTTRPLALYESGFAPRLYVSRDDVDEPALIPVQGQTFCPYKGVCSYYNIGDAARAAWSYENVWPEVRRISGLVSFEPDKITVHLDGTQLRLEPGQNVIPHGIDRDLTADEFADGRQS